MEKETKDYNGNCIDSEFEEIFARLSPVINGSECRDSGPTDPTKGWNDPDIYPVWIADTEPHTLDNLAGIHVPVIDGTEILLYPKYKQLPLLSYDKTEDWSAKNQYNPLYADIEDQSEATDELLSLGSKAAEFVREYNKDIALPIQLLAISKHKNKIDELSKLLGGDLLSCIGSYWWSLLRCNAYSAWCVYGTYGTFNDYYMYGSLQCLPVSLFKKN